MSFRLTLTLAMLAVLGGLAQASPGPLQSDVKIAGGAGSRSTTPMATSQ